MASLLLHCERCFVVIPLGNELVAEGMGFGWVWCSVGEVWGLFIQLVFEIAGGGEAAI
jgi:hypothetical protein